MVTRTNKAQEVQEPVEVMDSGHRYLRHYTNNLRGVGTVRGIDTEALANDIDKRRNRKVKQRYALRHIATGMYLKVENYKQTSYSTTLVDPSLNVMSAITYWLRCMDKPEEWEIVPMKAVVDEEALAAMGESEQDAE